MISRRDILIGAAASGACALLQHATDVLAAASQPSTPVNFKVPPGACDCHTHIFGDQRRFPFMPDRVYTPETASVTEMRALHRALRIERVVIVNPSVYGADNSCTLDAIRQLAPHARGVAVIDDRTPDAVLNQMGRDGIRAIRINLETTGQADPAVGRRRFQAAIERVKNRGWHVQIYTHLSMIEALQGLISAAPVPVVIDHFGGAQGALGIRQPGFQTLLKLVQTGKAYVKVSAPYRNSKKPPDYPNMVPLAQALIGANPERILWGTDWPHPDSTQVPGRKPTDIAPLYRIDDGRDLNQLAVWAPDEAVRRTILVDNPARLFGF